MTIKELEALPENTLLWDKDYGLVLFHSTTVDSGLAEVLYNGNCVATWIEDLSFPTGLLKELV